MKKYLSYILVAISAIVATASYMYPTLTLKAITGVRCANYSSRSQAQASFDSDPVKYKKLDGNHDLKACQSFKYAK